MPPGNGTVLDPAAASEFIDGYKRVLLQLGGTVRHPGEDILERLARGRQLATEDRGLLEKVVDECGRGNQPVAQDILAAILTLHVDDWVYLRDTKRYSIFLDASGSAALGVVGLTQGLREIVGMSGVVIETGVVRYRGLFVCDALISRIVQLGPSYRRSFNDAYRRLRMEGRFESRYIA